MDSPANHVNMELEGQNEQHTEVIDESFQRELLLKLDELRKANFLCDTTVRAEGQGFPAHRHVLSAGSDYFKALFSSDLQVKENQTSLVELNEMNSATISTVLQFIYTGKASINTSNAQDLLVASDYLIIPSLKSKAAQFLEESMNASNCLALEYFASQYNCDLLKQAAIKHKCQHFVAVVKSDDFLSLGFEKVKELMCEDELNITEEEEVYEAAMAWIKHDLSSRECFLPDLLKCLRLFSMSKYSLRKILNKEELVIKNPICTNIFIKGLDYFLCPDRFLGMSLRHRTSVEKEEHVVVLSGYDDNCDFSQDTYCFVLATKKWHLLPKIPDSCLCDDRSAGACAVSAGLWYLVSETRISYFNPKENVWRSKNTNIFCHPSCTLTTFNEELYLIGGEEYIEDDEDDVSCVFKYNPIFNEWKQLASMEISPAGHCAVVLEDLIYVIGGEDDQTCLQSVESYNPSTNQWRKAPDLTNPHRCAAAVTVCGKIFVIGGYRDVNLKIIEPTCEIFDVGLNLWSLVSSPNVPRAGCGIVSVDNTVYVFGGEDDINLLSSVECFDIKHNKWTQIDADMPECRTHVQASVLKLPKMFISSSWNV